MHNRIFRALFFLTVILLSCRGKDSPPLPAEAAESESVADKGEQLFLEYKKKLIQYPPKGEDFPYNFKGLKDVHILEALTGEYSTNKTSSNYDVYGTDLGIIFNRGDDVFIAFGDTFSGPNFEGNWRSNVLAYTTDHDASDGIRFDGMIRNKVQKNAIEILSSKKRDNEEMTVIPTGGFSLGETLYLCFMSVRHWGPPGQWDCNYGGIAKSTDNGQRWEKIASLQWDGGGNFVQLCPVVDGPYVYFFGIGGGRGGRAALMRVPAGSVENRDAYQYLSGFGPEGEPIYQGGTEAEQNPYTVIDRPVGEMSVLYNEYLGEWLVSYLGGEDLIMRSSKTLEGPWSALHYIARQKDYPSLYGAFMHPFYTEDKGRILYFLTSFFDPVYNVSVMKAEVLR